MKISVEQRHIDSGIRRNCCFCPVALAVKETTHSNVSVLEHTIVVGPKIHMVSGIGDFIRNFDSGLPVQPFEFELC